MHSLEKKSFKNKTGAELWLLVAAEWVQVMQMRKSIRMATVKASVTQNNTNIYAYFPQEILYKKTWIVHTAVAVPWF